MSSQEESRREKKKMNLLAQKPNEQRKSQEPYHGRKQGPADVSERKEKPERISGMGGGERQGKNQLKRQTKEKKYGTMQTTRRGRETRRGWRSLERKEFCGLGGL